MSPDLLHIVGYLTGAALYAMLLVMAVRDRSGDRLTLGTGVLGLAWNLGELSVYVLRALDVSTGEAWIAASSFTALGLLAAVVVHSVARSTTPRPSPRAWLAPGLSALAYVCASAAGIMHFWGALVGQPVPVFGAQVLLTSGLIAIAPVLLIATRGQANGPRASWMTALTVFAVSALHLGTFHGAREGWVAELLGHHASVPLAFAILYQDYRFALADLFLKQALSLLAGVVMIFGVWSLLGPAIAADAAARSVGLLLGLWMVSLLVYPRVQASIARFVDRVVLARANYETLLEAVAEVLERSATVEEALDGTCRLVAPALSASQLTWQVAADRAPGAGHDLAAVPVPTADPPHYLLSVGALAGGRRLLSDDLMMLERVALLLSRRLDAIRLTSERHERVLRDRDMQALATEAELRALRAQVNPHFLFNALTTIGYLIQVAPTRALDTLMQLTTLLRSVLKSDGEFTTLGRERDLIASYLRIERARFEERLDVTIDIPSTLHECPIPSLILQPLVENAVKHGIAGSRQGGRVVVEARLDGATERLRIAVRNTGAPLHGRHATKDGGIGLANVRRRLLAHYGEHASLTLHALPNGETESAIDLPAADHENLAVGAAVKSRR